MYGMPMSGSPFYGMMPNSDLQQGQRMSQLQQQQNQAAQQRVQASQQNTRTETQQEEQGQAQARGGAAGYRPGGNVQLRMPSAGRRPNLNPTGSINELQVRNAMEHFERGGALKGVDKNRLYQAVKASGNGDPATSQSPSPSLNHSVSIYTQATSKGFSTCWKNSIQGVSTHMRSDSSRLCSNSIWLIWQPSNSATRGSMLSIAAT
jgi:hypothetical protein